MLDQECQCDFMTEEVEKHRLTNMTLVQKLQAREKQNRELLLQGDNRDIETRQRLAQLQFQMHHYRDRNEELEREI